MYKNKLKSERGVILWITMVVLLVMMVMAAGLVRTTETATTVAGNIAFRQSSVSAADRGIQVGRQWLNDKMAGTDALGCGTLDTACAAAGYSPIFSQPSSGQTWEDFLNLNVGQMRDLGLDASGNRVKILLQRMCSASGVWNDPNNNCITQVDASQTTTSSKGAGRVALTGSTKLHYSIIVRVEGPKNTRATVQTIIQSDM